MHNHNNIKELITETFSIVGSGWIALTDLPSIIKQVDPNYSPKAYGCKKLLELLKKSEVVTIRQVGEFQPPIYEARLIPAGDTIHSPSTTHPMYLSLFSQYKGQDSHEIFAHFGWKGRDEETWETPFQKLAELAQSEPWKYHSDQDTTSQYPILEKYLNNTFLRIQQEKKINYDKEHQKCIFNTGLLTEKGEDIYAIFRKNSYPSGPDWTLATFQQKNKVNWKATELPETAHYITNPLDLVIDLTYKFRPDYNHIIDDNIDRFPEHYRKRRNELRNVIQGKLQDLEEKLKRNYKIAVPHWFKNKIQLLLPLEFDEEDAGLALVTDKNDNNKCYTIKTVLPLEWAYANARLICNPESLWLTPLAISPPKKDILEAKQKERVWNRVTFDLAKELGLSRDELSQRVSEAQQAILN